MLTHDPVEDSPWSPGVDIPADLSGIRGLWFSEGEPFTFSVVSGHLEARSPEDPADRAPSVFERVGDDLYRTVSGRERGELLRVTRDDAGTPVTMHWATYLCTRQPLAFGETP